MKKFVLGILAVLIILAILAEKVFASDVKISKETVKQGEFFEINIDGVSSVEIFTVIFQKRKYRSAPGVSEKSHRVIIPVHVFDSPGEAEILLESKFEITKPEKILIEKVEFKESEDVQIIKPLSPKDLKKHENEQKILSEIYRRTTKYPFFATIDRPFFEYPLKKEMQISSPFGFIRKRKVGTKSEKVERVSHGGIDFVVSKGTEVLAVEDGIVRLARELINSGSTVIIDHGYNIFSVYMHLSQVFVSEGEIVWVSDPIGRSGDTGRVTGPHLHFGMKVHDTWVDPKYFVLGLEDRK